MDGGEPPGFSIHVNECGSLDAVNREGGLVFFDVEWFGVPIAGKPCGELIGGVQQPRIASLGGKQDKLADGDNAPIVLSGPAQNVANFVGEAKVLAVHHAPAGSALDRFSTPVGAYHGIIHQAGRQPPGVRLPLLRPHCHSRLPQRPVAARAGGVLLPAGARRSGGEQGNLEPAHRRLPKLGGSLRPQSSYSDRLGREGRAQGRPCPCLATSNGKEQRLRRLVNFQKAWSRGRPSASACRNIPPRTRTTASLPASGAASHTITSTSAMKFSAPW